MATMTEQTKRAIAKLTAAGLPANSGYYSVTTPRDSNGEYGKTDIRLFRVKGPDGVGFWNPEWIAKFLAAGLTVTLFVDGDSGMNGMPKLSDRSRVKLILINTDAFDKNGIQVFPHVVAATSEQIDKAVGYVSEFETLLENDAPANPAYMTAIAHDAHIALHGTELEDIACEFFNQARECDRDKKWYINSDEPALYTALEALKAALDMSDDNTPASSIN